MTNIKLSEQFQRIVDMIVNPEVKRKILIRASAELKDRAAAYPVEGAWNSAPGTKRNNIWYQRQFGTRYKRKDGTLGGRNTSQKLQKSWQIEATDTGASVWTAVTYAPFLLDDARRVNWAARHGWQTTDEITEDYLPRFEKIVLDVIDE